MTDGADGYCGTIKPGETTSPTSPPAAAQSAVVDRDVPFGSVASIPEQQHYKRGKAPRELSGAVDGEPSGIKDIRLRLTRRVGKRCERLDPARERWVKAARCGADNSPFFSIGDRTPWSYLLPQALTKGRYVLDVQVADRAGNVRRGNTRGGVARAAQPRRVLRRLAMRAARALALVPAALVRARRVRRWARAPASDEAVRLTRHARLRRRRRSRDRRIDDVPESETVMRLLQRNARRQDALRRRLRAVHRRARAARRSTERRLVLLRQRQRGAEGRGRHARRTAATAIWWDRRDWSATQRVPAVVGSFPEPFLHGPGTASGCPCAWSARTSSRAPCRDGRRPRSCASASRPPRARCGARSRSETLRVVVGPWAGAARRQRARAARGRARRERRLRRAAADGRRDRAARRRAAAPCARSRAGAGLIAATAAGDDPPVWAVTGTDDAGVAAAARAFDERGAAHALRRRRRAAARPIALPLEAGR